MTTTKQLRPTKSFPDIQRWLNILVRTAHIGAAGVVLGCFVLDAPREGFPQWHHLLITTGIVLLLLEWLHDKNWPHRGNGLVAYLHVCLAALIHLLPSLTIPLLWAALISGCIGSHMSRRYRHWSFLHGPEKRL